MKNYWLIQRTTDGFYVAKPGLGSSYTKNLKHARMYEMRESAMANACSDERVISLAQELGVPE